MLTQEQQLQLPAGILLVSPQLLLDLLVDPLVLSVLRRHTAAGHGWTSPPAAPSPPLLSAPRSLTWYLGPRAQRVDVTLKNFFPGNKDAFCKRKWEKITFVN